MPRQANAVKLINDAIDKLQQVAKVIGNMQDMPKTPAFSQRDFERAVKEAASASLARVGLNFAGNGHPNRSVSPNTDRPARNASESTRRSVARGEATEYKTSSGRFTEAGLNKMHSMFDDGASTSDIAREFDATWRAINEQKKKWNKEQSKRQAEAEEAKHREEEARKAEERKQKRLENLAKGREAQKAKAEAKNDNGNHGESKAHEPEKSEAKESENA